MKVLLLGSTGMVGRNLLDKLLAHEKIQAVTTLSRRAIPELESNPKLTQHIVDFETLSEKDAPLIQDHEVLFNCMGTTRAAAGGAAPFIQIDHDYPLKVIKMHNGHGLVLLTSTGSNPNSWFLYPQTKGRLEEACKSLELPNLAILRPGLLLLEGKERPSSRLFEGWAIGFANAFGIKSGTAPISNVAQKMLQVALDFDPTNTTPNVKIYENNECRGK